MLMGHYDQEKFCRICGKTPIKSFHSGKYGWPPYYCSFKCNAIGEKNKLLIVYFMFLIVAIFTTIILYLHSAPTIALVLISILFFSFAHIFLFNSIYGYRANKKRNEQEEDQNYSANERSYQLKDNWVW